MGIIILVEEIRVSFYLNLCKLYVFISVMTFFVLFFNAFIRLVHDIPSELQDSRHKEHNNDP